MDWHQAASSASSSLPHSCSQSPAWTSVPCFSTASASVSIGPPQQAQRTSFPAASCSRCLLSRAACSSCQARSRRSRSASCSARCRLTVGGATRAASFESTAEAVRPGRRLAVVEQHQRAEQLHGVGVELRLPLRQCCGEVEVARAGGDTLLVLALTLLAARLLLRVVSRWGRALLALLLAALGLGGRVGGDLLPKPVREPFRIGDVAVIAMAVRRGKLEQAAERARS